MANLKDSLLEELKDIEGVTVQASPVAGGTALFYGGREFAHFHNDTEIDLRLTKKVIHAMELKHPEGSVHHPARAIGSPWIEVRYNDPAGVRRTLDLIRVAIKHL